MDQLVPWWKGRRLRRLLDLVPIRKLRDKILLVLNRPHKRTINWDSSIIDQLAPYWRGRRLLDGVSIRKLRIL